MDVFDECSAINEMIFNQQLSSARDGLIVLLSRLDSEYPYPDFLNHLIRELGLYPYMKKDEANWQDRFVYEAFQVDVGKRKATLHREQSFILSRLVEGQSVAVSAPTSFGKSFIIDAFIAMKNPFNVVIIVPTIALMDETRRRIYKKFSDFYNIITNTDETLASEIYLYFRRSV